MLIPQIRVKKKRRIKMNCLNAYIPIEMRSQRYSLLTLLRSHMRRYALISHLLKGKEKGNNVKLRLKEIVACFARMNYYSTSRKFLNTHTHIGVS